MATKNYSITIDEKLMKRADGIAKKHFIPTRSEFIRNALRHYIKYLQRKHERE